MPVRLPRLVLAPPVDVRWSARALLATLALAAFPSGASATNAATWEGAGGGAVSDLLIVLEPDGRGYTAQHTLSSEGPLVRLELPASVAPERVRFSGPERALFGDAWRRRPGRLALWSGAALVRYRHGYGEAVTEREPGVFSLRTASVPERLSVEDGELALSSITWLLPEGFEPLDAAAAVERHGRWTRAGNLLSFEQRGRIPVDLTLSYRRRGASAPGDGPCVGDDAACAPDVDADGVPDHRDVCLEAPRSEMTIGADETFPAPAAARGIEPFGCADGTGAERRALTLDGIAFPAGQSYLDINARRLLDRLALALEHLGDGLHEIAAHTDGAGSAAHNLALSERRARAVRHYLMLRGVDPNRLRARGYGERFPIDDERTAAGRRANRRIELRRLD